MLAAFLALPLIIKIHAGAALLALVIGPFAIWRRRRDVWHRVAGLMWIVLMLIVATSAWFIHEIQMIGPFSPIHLFSLVTYRALFVAIRHVRAGRYHAHGAAMRGLYLQALAITGLLTLLPGRALQRIFFGDQIILGFVVMACIGAVLVVMLFRKPRLAYVR